MEKRAISFPTYPRGLALLPVPLSQPYAGATAILVDEVNSTPFKRRSNFLDGFPSPAQLTLG
jgi:hypothetical protein